MSAVEEFVDKVGLCGQLWQVDTGAARVQGGSKWAEVGQGHRGGIRAQRWQ